MQLKGRTILQPVDNIAPTADLWTQWAWDNQHPRVCQAVNYYAFSDKTDVYLNETQQSFAAPVAMQMQVTENKYKAILIPEGDWPGDMAILEYNIDTYPDFAPQTGEFITDQYGVSYKIYVKDWNTLPILGKFRRSYITVQRENFPNAS